MSTMRYQYQLCNKLNTDDAYESEWEQFKNVAIMCVAKALVHDHKKFGSTDMVGKVINTMNYKQKPIIITLGQAYQLLNQPYHQ